MEFRAKGLRIHVLGNVDLRGVRLQVVFRR